MIEVEAQKTSPVEQRHAEPAIIYDIVWLLNTIFQQTVEATQSDRIYKRVTNKLRAHLKGTPRYGYENDEYPDMLTDFLLDIHLLQISRNTLDNVKPVFRPGPGYHTWSQLDLHHQTRYILQSWYTNYLLTDTAEREYFYSDHIYLSNKHRGREILVRYIEQHCKQGLWYPVKDLLTIIWKNEPLVMRYVTSYTRKTELKRAEDQDQWLTYDGKAYIGMLESTLFDLGIVSLGYDRPFVQAEPEKYDVDEDDGPELTSFMLTEFGAQILALKEITPENIATIVQQCTTEKQTQGLIVQPTFEIMMLQPSMTILYSLLPFVQIKQLGQVQQSLLTQNSILRALGNGLTIDRIIQLLEQHSQKALPQNVIYTLRDWAKNFKAARIAPVWLIEASDEVAAEQLCKNPTLKQSGIHRIGPR